MRIEPALLPHHGLDQGRINAVHLRRRANVLILAELDARRAPSVNEKGRQQQCEKNEKPAARLHSARLTAPSVGLTPKLRLRRASLLAVIDQCAEREVEFLLVGGHVVDRAEEISGAIQQ